MKEDIQLYHSLLIHDGYHLKFIDNNIYRRLGLHNCIILLILIASTYYQCNIVITNKTKSKKKSIF